MKTIGRPWFAARRFGYGAGVPITWQGWAVLSAMLVSLPAASIALRGWPRVLVMIALLAVFMRISAAKTEGGWRSRWRGFDDPR